VHETAGWTLFAALRWLAGDGFATENRSQRERNRCGAIRRRPNRSSGLNSCATCHYTDRAQRYDEERTRTLGLDGIRLIRFTNPEVLENFESVCARVLTALEESP
jgi:hypothetical protein